jgi:capsular polysaccharide biosynthesis protein
MKRLRNREFWRRIGPLRSIARGLWRLSRDLPRHLPIQAIPALQRWSGRPLGYYLTVTEYLEKHPERGWEKLIAPGGSYERIRPQPSGPALPARFDPPQTVTWEDERVLCLEDCRYWGEYGGAFVAHDERLISELSPDVWGLERHAIFNRFKLPNLQDLSGLSAVISTPEASTNYSHWMMDLIPRLDLLARAGFGPDKVDRYLVNLGGAPYERETLRLAGIPAEKIVPVTGASHFCCERLVTTSLRQRHWQHSLPAWVPTYLRSLTGLGKASLPATRRLYLTRRTASFRRVLNEEALLGLLAANGFEVIDPGSLSVMEQAALFASAAVIVSPHSSAMTNLVFCPPGTTVLEIFPADYFDVSFWTAASIAGCTYHALLGSRPPGPAPSTKIEGRRQDIAFNEGQLSCVAHFLQHLGRTFDAVGKLASLTHEFQKP